MKTLKDSLQLTTVEVAQPKSAPSSRTPAKRKLRWSQERVLTIARQRTRELIASPDKVQQMLAELMVESGWSDEEFVDALCRDVIKTNGKGGKNHS